MDVLSVLLIAAGVLTIAVTCAADVRAMAKSASVQIGGTAVAGRWTLRTSASQSAAGLGLLMTGVTLQEPGHPIVWLCMSLIGVSALVASYAWLMERRTR
jgi:hypothetical protein